MSKSAEHPALVFNVTSNAFRADPYPIYHALRAQTPVYYFAELSIWLITRHSDVAALLKDARLVPNIDNEKYNWEGATDNPLLSLRQKGQKVFNLWLSNRNPPDHTRLRKFFHQTFAPEQIPKLQTRMQTLVDAYIDRVTPQGEMDVIKDLGYPFPFAVICDILGIPEESRSGFQRLAHELQGRLDVGTTQTARERGLMAVIGLSRQFQGFVDQWRIHPPAEDNMIYALIRAQADGELSDEELVAQCSMLLIGGYINTRHLIGNSMLALLRNPEQLEMLRRQPKLLETAIDELQRFDSPNQMALRIAKADVEIHGVTIRKGQVVCLMVGAANRDPEVFSDPDRLDITRRPNPHLSFGHGIHYCIGAALGKLEAQVAIGTLIRRLPRLRLKTEALEWEETFVIRGLKSLPVVFN